MHDSPDSAQSTSTGDCAPAVLLSSTGSPPKEVSTSSSSGRSSSTYSTTTSSSSSDASRRRRIATAKLEAARARLAIAEAEEELTRVDERDEIECNEIYDVSDAMWREIPFDECTNGQPADHPVTRLIAFYYLMQFSHFIIEFQNEMQLLHFLQLHLYIFNNCIYANIC